MEKTPDIINRLHSGETLGTKFSPGRNTSSIKKWIAHSYSNVKGQVIINNGAKASLMSTNASSLLPVGVSRIDGDFRKGDIIRILDEDLKEIGLGKSKYGSKKPQN